MEGLTTIRLVQCLDHSPHGDRSAISILVVHMAIVVFTSNNVPIMLAVLDIVIACSGCRLQHPLCIQPVCWILMIDMIIAFVTCNDAPGMLGINNVVRVLAWGRNRK